MRNITKVDVSFGERIYYRMVVTAIAAGLARIGPPNELRKGGSQKELVTPEEVALCLKLLQHIHNWTAP